MKQNERKLKKVDLQCAATPSVIIDMCIQNNNNIRSLKD